MRTLIERQTRAGLATIAHTTRDDGDLSPSLVEPHVLARRRRAVLDLPWFHVNQVHGAAVGVIGASSDPGQRVEADALVTAVAGRAIVVHVGDCVPVGLIHEHGAVAVVHAGWKGLVAGVVSAGVSALRRSCGPGVIDAAIGPHIRPACYEFGSVDLAVVEEIFGSAVRAHTSQGGPALDLTAAVSNALAATGIESIDTSDACTACEASTYWSHRARGEGGRIALVGWIDKREDRHGG